MCDVKGAMLCLLSSVDRRDGGRNRPGSRRGRGKGGGCDREVQVVERVRRQMQWRRRFKCSCLTLSL
jgi:hypothetical protein